MGAYIWLLLLAGYLVMMVVFVGACVLYMFSLPVKLRVHVPSDDAQPAKGDGATGPQAPPDGSGARG